MEVLYKSIGIASVVTLLWVSLRVLNWVWLRPRKLEKALRQQGLNGNPYKLLFGDLKENARMMKEAKSRPLKLSNDIGARVLPFVLSSVQTYGRIFFSWVGPTPRVHIADPELVKEVLTKNFTFVKPEMNPLFKLFVTGLGSYEGEQWAKHRKIINSAFHIQKLKHMIPAIYSSCSEMINTWNSLLSLKEACELDVWPYLQTLTADIISRTAFGSNYEEGNKIFQLQKEQGELLAQAMRTVYIPRWRFLPTKRNKRMKQIHWQVRDALVGIIHKRMKAIDAGEAGNDDLLGALLESNLKEIQQHENNKKVGLSIDEVIEECKLFYFAGHETTSVLLTWMMILLSWHPEWQHRAREEVLQMFGVQTPTFDDLNHLKIVTSILHETLRLYPPISSIVRTVKENTKLGGMLLPAGVQVFLSPTLIHHDPEIWGNDAKEFKPERFFEGISKATKNTISYLPFGRGPRICIGQNFALLEAKMVLTMILQRFFFELSPSYSHAPHGMIAMQPQYGAHLILHKV